MTLTSASERKLSTIREEDFQQMYHFPESVKHMESLFYATHSYVKIRDIVKRRVKESSKFRHTPIHFYKTTPSGRLISC